ncbi:DNA-binding transcriptional regulator, AcrR family [Evansella caseinilytica]|uniref:DNA-binding transcriptional regulator, AcrR family n=1 Tax=Evansella caseinilytica TaxID=1503961 RepID=A0A1H3IBX1_9BACI|nr:TetR/AcrR family transcriptional regulator [Evansella caseinilytica]SDY25191.1 DNA-binding transcriptional regulator, AcrR family [Evansella caseinilytica]
MSTDDKRQRLIAAAYKVFSRKGYNNASIKEVATEAGITPGLVHYYFKNKEELLLSVQADIQQQYHSQYEDAEKAAVGPLETLLEIKSRVEDEPDWYRWRYELYSLGLKNESLKQEAAAILHNGRKSLSHPLQTLIDNAEEAEALASILLACFDGLALQKMMADDFNLDRTYKLLFTLLENYFNKKADT